MKKLTGEQIIRTYIEFFKERGHTEIESSSLIPHDDPSVLWINAGVTPLKKYFDGTAVPINRRLTSCQKCIRTGDIESVGKTARHHTFFQMLGNFSVGDYFRTEAITWAYELLTSKKYFDIPKSKLYVTVYPEDKETYDLWVKLGIDESHIVKLENNFWEIGEGPSGPDSEIFYDRGPKYDKEKLGIKLLENEIENDRYIEIWNNVFSQYNAKEGVERSKYEELPSKNIDTGMGVERMACILQETETNYETDLFMPIMDEISEICQIKYQGQMEFKVIADHIRTITFAISDGASFENYGRGYVLRRLLRRAARMGRKLNINHTFMDRLVDVVVDKYMSIYPELAQNRNRIKELVVKEEELFQKTLLQGEKRLETIFKTNKKRIISGADAFKLYDTYGFPVELTEEYATENNFIVDTEGFKKYMDAQKEQARLNRKVDNSMNMQNELLLNYKKESKFVGYEKLGVKTKVLDIIKNNKLVERSNTECYIFLEENPFYAESGGQVSDKGYLKNDDCKLEVLDVIKCPNKQHLLHVKVLEGEVVAGAEILTHVLQDVREATCRNHSSTHLIQKTLQELLGSSVHQAGSKVDENTFRFDFNYHGRLSDELIVKVEEEANKKVAAAVDAKISYMDIEDAKKLGAMALFEDKYEKVVRVVQLGDSIELCGGTHVNNTKDIGRIAILSVENKGADTFRLEGTTKDKIKDKIIELLVPYQEEVNKLLDKCNKLVAKAKEEGIDLNFNFEFADIDYQGYQDIVNYKQEIERLKQTAKELDKEYQNNLAKKSLSDLTEFKNLLEEVNGYNILIGLCKNYDVSILKQVIDSLSNTYPNSFILLANVKDSSMNIFAKSTIDNDNIHCGNIVKEISSSLGGNGGGNAKFAQGGATKTDNLKDILANYKTKIVEILK